MKNNFHGIKTSTDHINHFFIIINTFSLIVRWCHLVVDRWINWTSLVIASITLGRNESRSRPTGFSIFIGIMVLIIWFSFYYKTSVEFIKIESETLISTCCSVKSSVGGSGLNWRGGWAWAAGFGAIFCWSFSSRMLSWLIGRGTSAASLEGVWSSISSSFTLKESLSDDPRVGDLASFFLG